MKVDPKPWQLGQLFVALFLLIYSLHIWFEGGDMNAYEIFLIPLMVVKLGLLLEVA